MFEYTIQEAWKNHREDFGLSRICLFSALFNCFLFFYIMTEYGILIFSSLIPVFFSIIFYFLRPWVIKHHSLFIFITNSLLIGLSIILNYVLIGLVDKYSGGLPRLDQFFLNFDLWLFNKTLPAVIIEHFMSSLGLLGQLYYDVMITSYCSFFLLPLYGGILYYLKLPDSRRFKLGRYFSSIIIFFSLNYLFYLAIPVTGPQYFLKDYFKDPIPYTIYGKTLAAFVRDGQTTFIDCFPSGHSGIAILVCYWLFKIYHPHRFFMLILSSCIILATISLRFHYVWDVVAAFPLAYLAFKLAYLLFPVKVMPSIFEK